MTAMLDKIRQLERAVARGELDRNEAEREKARLMNHVEEVAEPIPAIPEEAPAPANTGHVVLFIFAAAALATTLAAFILGDLMLAMTLSVTLLAAITVRAFKSLDD